MAKTVNVWSWLSLWWYSRDLRLLLKGLPALVFAAGAITLFACGAGLSQQDLDARYLDKARDAHKNEDYQTEKTCLERVAYRGKERPDILFARAQNAFALKENTQGMMIMEQAGAAGKAWLLTGADVVGEVLPWAAESNTPAIAGGSGQS